MSRLKNDVLRRRLIPLIRPVAARMTDVAPRPLRLEVDVLALTDPFVREELLGIL